ncbi:hypothetical protein BDW22DRAFT_1433514 [Trametopsis cervina]|nr:hypothetical protein BDW22DRAFT_1433514 [Trametopsis cervina]
MSSPIAINRRAPIEPSSPTGSSTSTSTSESKYVPLHKRQPSAGSSSSRSPSPVQDTPNWRAHSPSSPHGRKFPAHAFAHHEHTQPRTHIPPASSIPQPPTTHPLTYSVPTLLALRPAAIPLTAAQRASIASVSALLALPINNDKAALRRPRRARRGSRAHKPTVPTPTVVDVEVRRTRHGHGTWGWSASPASLEEADDWRHAPMAVVA